MKNNKWVIVKVNDRGPFVKTRIIDLSWGAARELGMINEGLAKVYIELAEEIVIPLRPGKHHYEVPRLILDIDADTVKPVWQHELEIDHKKMQQRMKRTAQKTLFERLRKRIDW
jgi:rare lipoprotein A